MKKRLTAEEKGVIVEELIRKIFTKSGLKIFDNGAEMQHREFFDHFMEKKKKGLTKHYDPRLRQLLSMSDFLLENRFGRYNFVEGKFRSIHHFPGDVGDDLINRIDLMKHFHQYQKFWKPEVILVTSEPLETTGMFSVISYPYYEKKGKEISLVIRKITDVDEWRIKHSVVKECEEEVRGRLL